MARLIDRVVDASPRPKERFVRGQRAYDPRMLFKVLIFAYATGTFSSRKIAQNCSEHLAYLFLSRGEQPCFRTICSARTDYKSYLEQIWLSFLATAASEGMPFAGRIAVDASRFKADASGDLVVEKKDYDALIALFEELLSKGARVDATESSDETASRTHTGVEVSRVTVRKVVRSLGKEAPKGEITPRTEKRLEECRSALIEAKKEELRHVSLTDPDARMMPVGSQKRIGMGHALEVAADSGSLVAGGSTNAASDTGRLAPLVKEARLHDPATITDVVADSGYFDADDVVGLQDSGVRVVVPDATTAGQMRKNDVTQEANDFQRIEGEDAYRCPNGRTLHRIEAKRRNSKRYRPKEECTDCPLASTCLKNKGAKRRTISVRPHAERIWTYLKTFGEEVTRATYYARGPAIETVFAYLRRIIGFTHWSVRGSEKVAAEAALLKCAYQVRKLQSSTRKKAAAA